MSLKKTSYLGHHIFWEEARNLYKKKMNSLTTEMFLSSPFHFYNWFAM